MIDPASATATKLSEPGDDTLFVLGNGPSLTKISLPELSPFATIGMNSAYRFWRKIDWRPTYYTCLDTVVGISHKQAISELIDERRIKKFLLRANLIRALGAHGRSENVVNFDAEAGRNETLAALPVTTGSHAALWAAALGYKRIILLGVDANYQEVVRGAAKRSGIELEIVAKADNPNYFFEDYQLPGDKYNIPNPRPGLHLAAWREAAVTLKRFHTDVSVFQANDQSAVEFFPFIDFKDFANGIAISRPARADIDMDLLRSSERKSVASKERLFLFVRSYGVLFIALTLSILMLVFVAGPAITGLAAADIAAYIALTLGLAAILITFYSRKAILDHLHDLDHTVSKQGERLRDLERQKED